MATKTPTDTITIDDALAHIANQAGENLAKPRAGETPDARRERYLNLQHGAYEILRLLDHLRWAGDDNELGFEGDVAQTAFDLEYELLRRGAIALYGQHLQQMLTGALGAPK